ncbi:hypothetical protein [Bacillus solimangrovi]|uniref:Uncharacterized protein n=1 Tax=Bacillus solimangrovi TaxID=1305675 RepID=A0A1E5LCY6_9BACI|nr:hypothetical protein [Bacillus solimangrovi]OEH91941.1 hypothetical protein BFG57_17535 [Bacillus solimangrovi]
MNYRYRGEPVRVMEYGGRYVDGIMMGESAEGVWLRGRGGRRIFRPRRLIRTIILLRLLRRAF